MPKTVLLVSTIWIILLSELNFNCVALQEEVLDDFDTSKAMVGFNPYVSVLDMYNYSRYGITELIPLFAKLATRFERVHIQLGISRFSNKAKIDDEYPSLVLSPLAAAKYNCLPTTKHRIEVFLEIDHYNKACNCNRDKIYQMLHAFLTLAEKANMECNATVRTIVLGAFSKRDFGRYCSGYSCSLPKSSKNNVQEVSKLLPNFHWGVSVSFDDYCSGDINDLSHHFSVSALIVYFSTYDEYFKQNSTFCQFHNYNKSDIHPFQVTKALILTNDYVAVNMSTKVSRWKNIMRYPSDIYYFSLAFEPHNDHLYYGYGWWYLIKDPGDTNTSEFIFEEKVTAASKVDYEENPRNYKWLEKEQIFNRNSTAVLSFEPKNFGFPTYYGFCRIIVLKGYDILELDSILKLGTLRFDVESCENGRHVYVIPPYYSYPETNMTIYTITKTDTKLRYGHLYPLETCAKITDPEEDFTKFWKQLHSQRIKVILFYFHEDEPSTEVRMTQHVLERIVLFEKCKEIVQSVRSEDVEIAFVSLGYFMVDNFYSSVKAMQDYVKYVHLLSDWAEKQNNIVVCIGLLEDRKQSFDRYADVQSYVGFYSYSEEANDYVSKSQQALQLSQSLFPELIYNSTENFETTVGLNTTQYVIIFCSLALIVTISTLLVTYLVRRYYKSNKITETEMDVFSNGDQSSDIDIWKASYDKEKYEISTENFTFEQDNPLGKGEFGVVYRGIIDTMSDEIRVAVKTSNPEKSHKTIVNGLLSEIKVLAFIGKHPNIIELLGANTEELENGKVYIFLEFCHLGSLRNFLMDLRMPMSSRVQESNVDTLPSKEFYVNSLAENTIILDSALSGDLYRWSREICNGMAFLHEKHVVHADLATRNVLLNLRREAKICDFGLSRRMYNYTNYAKSKQEPLPWKWMAPEALRDMQFNEKTDVWAFGVTLWEIYSLGSTPYAGLSWDPNFSQMLERGLRLGEPEYCERDMFTRMQKCWAICPDHRPTFSEILNIFDSSDGHP